jgi:hypothetical protein
MTSIPSGALAEIRLKLESAHGEPRVQQTIRHHYEHLERLASSLRTLGMDERQIDDNVLEVFREYEVELQRYLATLPRIV